VNTKTIEKMAEIQRWCLENNSDTFTCFCNFSGHTESLAIHINPIGYFNDEEALWVTHSVSCLTSLNHVLTALKAHKTLSDERNKPENAKALKAEQLETMRIKNKKAEEQLEMEIDQL
jgi:hypothetical protein